MSFSPIQRETCSAFARDRDGNVVAGTQPRTSRAHVAALSAMLRDVPTCQEPGTAAWRWSASRPEGGYADCDGSDRG